MSGKEKAENFDDDFELDALDEASWSDDEAVSESDADQASGEDHSKGKAGKTHKGEKKSGGGLLSGLIVLALLGGGSFYAYQSGLIPGLSPGSSATGESVMPALTDADSTTDSTTDTAAEAIQTAELSEDMPPMPDAAVAGDAPIAEGAVEVAEDTGASLAPAPVADSDDDALTPMPEIAGDSAAELSPLDAGEGEIELAQTAEKDGMAVVADSTEAVSDAVAAVDGKLEDGIMAIPGTSNDLTEDSLPLVGDSAAAPSSADLDEAALLGETEKVPSLPEAAAAAPAPAEGQDPLSELSEELATADTAESQAIPDATIPDAAPAPEAEPAKAPEAAEAKPAEPNKVEAAAPTKPADSPAKAETPKPAKPVVTPNWVLKSAKPGLAVLYDKRTGDVKTIGVGDRVSGLGTIKSVAKVDGKWVVQGTSGKVRQ